MRMGPKLCTMKAPVQVQEVVFVLDRFGYCKLLDKSTYERNQETVDTEQVHVIRCLNTDKICLFAASGSLYQIKAMDVPAGKLRDKGVPIENLSKYDGTKDSIVYLTCAQDLKGATLVFATKMAMVKQVPAEEFETNNRMVAATSCRTVTRLYPSFRWRDRRKWCCRPQAACSCGSRWRRYPSLRKRPGA